MIYSLLLLAIAGFIQNMAFTWVSRSRNSGDADYHRYAAWCSNLIWFAMQVIVIQQVMPALMEGDWITLAITAAVYTASTSEGSVFMMKYLIKHETGKRKVGA